MRFTTQSNYRLLLYVNSLVIVLLGAAFAGWGVFWSFPTSLGEGYHSVQAAVREIEKALFWKVAALYAVISFLILLAMVVLHLLYSHRIAGPAYRLGREAAKIAQGDLTGNIKFRQKDALTDIADSLGEMASQYRVRLNAVKDYLALVETQSKTLYDLIQQGREGDALKRASGEIVNTVNDMGKDLSEIRTETKRGADAV